MDRSAPSPRGERESETVHPIRREGSKLRFGASRRGEAARATFRRVVDGAGGERNGAIQRWMYVCSWAGSWYRWTEKQVQRQADNQTGRQAGGQTDRPIDEQVEKHGPGRTWRCGVKDGHAERTTDAIADFFLEKETERARERHGPDLAMRLAAS